MKLLLSLMIMLAASSAEARPTWLDPAGESRPTVEVSASTPIAVTGIASPVIVNVGTTPFVVSLSTDSSVDIPVPLPIIVSTAMPVDCVSGCDTVLNVSSLTVTISSTVIHDADGDVLDVNEDGSINVVSSTANPVNITVVSDPSAPVIIQDESASDAELGRLFHSPSGIQTVGSASEEDAFLWVVPSTCTIKMIFDRLYMSVFDTDMIFQFYSNPVITSSGTPNVVHNAYHGSPSTACAKTYYSPTISDRGALAYVYQISDQTIADPIGSRLLFDPGEVILLTVDAGGTNKDWAVDLFWVEK